MFATPNPTWAPGGISTSNSYVINAYGNTVDTSGNDFSPEKAIFYNKTFMRNHTAKLVHGQFGEKMTMPKHSGNIVNIRGMSPYQTAKTPLQEGVTPPGNTMDFYYVEIPVYQYGKFTPVTDFAEFASRDDILIHDAEELSSQSGRTLEEIDADVLNSGTEVIYAPAVASDGTVTEVNSRAALTQLSKFSVTCVFRAVNHLEIQNAEPIGDSYVAIIHPNVKYDVMTSEGFISIVKYNAAERLFRGEIGMIGNVRFVVSSFAKVFRGAGAEGKDVYSTLVLGKDAYKVIEIEGQGMHTIIKALGSGGTADPLDQRATQGWKTTHGIGITGETNMVRVESCSGSNLKTVYTGVGDNWKRMSA
jgi:N4-gp56 family major capsid protein